MAELLAAINYKSRANHIILLMNIFVLLIVLTLIIPPFLTLALGAFSSGSPGSTFRFSLNNFRALLGNEDILSSLVNSVIYAAVTATTVTIVGTFIAWVIERTDARTARLAQGFAIIPILIPAVTLVSSWIMLLSPRGGIINLAWQAATGSEGPLFDIFSLSGMIWVTVVQELPLAILWLWPVMRATNPDLEEAARVAGASGWRTVRSITLPLLFPALAGGWLIFFIYALGALSVPIMIGLPARIFLYSTEIYLATTRIPTQYGLAGLYSVLFLAVAIGSLYFYNRLIGDTDRFSTIRGKSFRPRRQELGRWRLLIDFCVVIILLMTAGLPIMVLVWNSLMPYPQLPSIASLMQASLANYSAALDYGPAVRAIWNSLWIGALAGIATTLLGAVIAWLRLRSRDAAGIALLSEQVGTMPIAIPGMIVGVSFLWLSLMLPVGFYGGPWILLLAYVTLHLPYTIRICTSGLLQLHVELEEAASVSGATRMAVTRLIVFPLLLPTLTSAAIYASLRAFREYAASVFLTSPGTEVFSVVVLDMWQGGNSGVLSAYAVMVMILLSLILFVVNLISSRYSMKH